MPFLLCQNKTVIEKNQILNKEKIIILIWQGSFCVLAKIEAINERIQISNINIAQAKYLIGLSQRIKKDMLFWKPRTKHFFHINDILLRLVFCVYVYTYTHLGELEKILLIMYLSAFNLFLYLKYK